MYFIIRVLAMRMLAFCQTCILVYSYIQKVNSISVSISGKNNSAVFIGCISLDSFFVKHRKIKQDLMACALQAMFRDSNSNANHLQVSHTFFDQTIVCFVRCVINFFVQHREIKQDLIACGLQAMFRVSNNNANHSQVSHTFFDQTIVCFCQLRH